MATISLAFSACCRSVWTWHARTFVAGVDEFARWIQSALRLRHNQVCLRYPSPRTWSAHEAPIVFLNLLRYLPSNLVSGALSALKVEGAKLLSVTTIYRLTLRVPPIWTGSVWTFLTVLHVRLRCNTIFFTFETPIRQDGERYPFSSTCQVDIAYIYHWASLTSHSGSACISRSQADWRCREDTECKEILRQLRTKQGCRCWVGRRYKSCGVFEMARANQ